jgi:CHAT domain-containing protein/tetratricopeptide (TPR) repeat protein
MSVAKARALVSRGETAMASGDVEQAITRYHKALRRLYRAGAETDRVSALLAIAYDARVLGSRAENIAQILVYTDSLHLDDSELRAVTRILRGKAFRDRSAAAGSSPTDRGIALSFLEDALKLLRKRDSPYYWAQAHLEIGKTLLGTAQAGQHLRKALEVYRRDTYPAEFAMVHEQLGHDRRAAGDRTAALGHYSLALAGLTADANPEQQARLHVAMARLARGGTGTDDIAVSHYEEAIGGLTRPEHAAARERVLAELAWLHVDAGRWASAMPRFAEALELASAAVGMAHTVGGRLTAASGVSELATGLAYCQYQLGQLDEALITLESGKVRLLTETLQWTSEDLSVPDRQRLAGLYREIRKLEATQYGGMSSIEDSDRLGVLRKQLTTVLERTPPPKAFTLPEMVPGEPRTALVVPLVSAVGSALIILVCGDQRVTSDNVVPLPELTTIQVNSWLYAYLRRGDDPEDHEAWLTAMPGLCEDMWRSLVSPLHDRLTELGVSRITIVPSAGLQFLPLHAAARPVGNWLRYFADDVTVSYAPSAYVLATSRRRRRDRALTGTALIAGASQYESLPPLPSVRTELELVGAALASPVLLDEQASRGRVLDAMAGAPIVHLACHGANWALGGATWRLAWAEPAVLHLARGGLSFQDILLQDMREVRLVCLSACDTGLVDASLPWDEFHGLANVFLQAGAAAIVSSLWPVADLSTALLMLRFYENLQQRGKPPAVALQEAQLWLRDSTRAGLAAVYQEQIGQGRTDLMPAYTDLLLAGDGDDHPYAHPFYWAPFTLTGV